MKTGKIIFNGKTEKGRNIVIRYPNKNDIEVMHDYVNALSREQTYVRFQREQVSLDEETKYLDSQLEKIEKNEVVYLLAFFENKLVGVAGIDMRDKIQKHIGRFGISVKKEFRNEGIGKLLMKVILEEVQKTIPDLKIVVLEVFNINKSAMEMYKKFGFKQYGFLPKGLIYKGSFEDQMLMYKEIDSNN